MGYSYLAVAVAVFMLIAPALLMFGLLYLLIPLHRGRRLPLAIPLCRMVASARRWQMLDVYLLGVLVSFLKLGKLATLTLGTSFWAFVALILCLTLSLSAIDFRELWARLEVARLNEPAVDFAPDTAAGHGLALCHSCNRVDSAEHSHCPRCDAPLHVRKPASLQRTVAFAVAALILYIPANLLPVLRLDGVTGPEQNTIVGGVIQFWQSGDYPVALIIFCASVCIPILKLLSITALCIVFANREVPTRHDQALPRDRDHRSLVDGGRVRRGGARRGGATRRRDVDTSGTGRGAVCGCGRAHHLFRRIL